MIRRFLCVITMVIVLAATIVTLTEFGNFGIAQGQGNLTLTPQQKAAMCNPSNPKLKYVNGTESRICGIPKTIKQSVNASAANSTSENNSTSAAGIAPSMAFPP